MSTFRVTVQRRNIITLVQSGRLRMWSRDFAKKVESNARRLAPKRTGRLAASHVTLPTAGTNQYATRYRVSAMAYYGAYVHQGTGIFGPQARMITSVKGMGPMPNARESSIGRRPKYIWSSRGQKGKPWLEQAAAVTVAQET